MREITRIPVRTAAAVTAGILAAGVAIGAACLPAHGAVAQEADSGKAVQTSPETPAGAPPAGATPTPTPPAAVTPGKTPPESSDAQPADVALFKQAVATMGQSRPAGTESHVDVTGNAEGMSIAFHERVRLTSAPGHRFRSEIQVVNGDGTPGAKYLAVGDGQKVWIYRPGTGQYSVTPYGVFEASSDDLFVLGMLGSLIVETGGRKNPLPDIAELRQQGGTFTVAPGTGEERVFTIHFPKGGDQRITFTVSRSAAGADTPVMVGMTVSGSDSSKTFQMADRVEKITFSPAVTADLFRWSPPKGAVRVNKVAIGPF